MSFLVRTERTPGRDQLREGGSGRVRIASADRLARNSVQHMVLLAEFAHSGCQFDLLAQPIRPAPQHYFLLHMRGAVAEYARTVIAECMRRGRQMKLRAGVLLPWPSPPTAIGCLRTDLVPAGVELEPTAGAVVQEWFRLAA
jgi:site-specific DNA recombinase